ncbi:amidohydrolase family protein [Rhizohabitans arisaemae]|uniref:amidohydrolase family protein n=1 Tax=Rhizohabitans arisaemae TaxID=2720610 RepID=UPI0024B0C7F3|nr:amidohydrolase family protein [Rhizohabitans arisaemae]
MTTSKPSSKRPSGPERPPAPLVLADVGAAWVGPAGARGLVHGVDVVVEDGRVRAVGPAAPRPGGARVLDASRWIVLPGMVNAHHHLNQQLTRTLVPAGSIDDWLAAAYPRWSLVDARTAWAGARAGLAELVLTGVTTVGDLSYYFPRGHADVFDAQVEAAAEIGCRMVAARGGLRDAGPAVRRRVGDLVDATIESPDFLLAELDRVFRGYHDPADDAMVKVAVGLTEPLWDEPDLMRELSAFARSRDLRMHTHLHPRPSDHEATGGDVVARLSELGWWGPDVWVAHGTRLDARERAAMAADGVALATCPSSNARLATPIAPAWALHREGGVVALGVDGAASNDGGDFLLECRLAWQVQRIAGGPAASGLLPEVVLDWATAGGARALGWPGLGELRPGGLADLACFDVSGLDFAGVTDLLAGLVLCGISHRAETVIVGGRVVVEDRHLVSADEDEIARTAHRHAKALRDGAREAGL